ncbi:MAG: hypothetical protein GEV03_29085 [Streptosporangiales bacterium]|nr:hypothetical protein [Streptosporangiales bacterium]
MEFRLLGSAGAYTSGRRIEGPGCHAKHRLVMAVLLAAEGRPVTTERLIAQLWDDEPPKTAPELVYHYVSELRRCLEKREPGAGDMLPSYDGGYRIVVDRAQVDVCRFHDLLAAAQRLVGDDDMEAVRLFREALRQWGADATGLRGGEPLAGLTGRWVANYRHTLQEEHRAAVIACLEAELRLGYHSRLVPDLADLANADPPDEQVAGLLMLAYYRAGRQADALRTFQSIRLRLVDDIGAEPGKDLKQLHQQILNQDPALDVPGSPDQHHAASGEVAADMTPGSGIPEDSTTDEPVVFADPEVYQLPRDPSGLVGRDAELAELDGLLRPGGDPAKTAVIAVVQGMARCGKDGAGLTLGAPCRTGFSRAAVLPRSAGSRSRCGDDHGRGTGSAVALVRCAECTDSTS